MAKKKTQSPDNKFDFSITQWAALFGLAVFFLSLPYRQGLFNGFTYNFELPIYEAMIFMFAVFLVALAYFARYMKYDSLEFAFGIGMLLMPLIYWISSFQAVAYHNAVLMVFIYGLYAVFFLTALSLVKTKATRLASEGMVFMAGYVIVGYGLLAAMGQASVDAYKADVIWLAHDSYRLTSVFQYSNTYAGFLLALLLGTAFAAINVKRTITACVHAFMLVPILISFMLTYSRGALVLAPIFGLIVLVFLRLDKQFAYAATLFGAGVVTFSVLSPFTNNYIAIAERVVPKTDDDVPRPLPVWDQAAWKGWLMLLGASVAVTLVIWAVRTIRTKLEPRLSRWSQRKYSVFILPVGGATIGIICAVLLFGTGIASKALPQSIAERIANINFRQHSVLERLTFYRDALKLSTDYPLLGAGGGGWDALYEQYQNNPYTSRQAHSFFFQTLVEVGWIGLLLLVALIGGIFFIYLRNYWRERHEQPGHYVFFILSFCILAHSIIDFDMSYVYIGALVFFSLGVLAGAYRDKYTLPRLSLLNRARWRFLYPAILAVLSVTLLFQVLQEYAANNYYRMTLEMAVNERRPLEELFVPLDHAIENSPAHPTYAFLKIDWLSQAYQQTKDRSYAERAQQLINRMVSVEPYDRQIILAKYRNHKDLKEYKEAVAVLEEGIYKFQWDINFYEAAIMEYAVNGRSLYTDDPDTAEEYWKRGLKLYDEVLRRINMLRELPAEQLQGRNFQVTPFLRQAVGQIYYSLRQYEEAVEILQPLQDSDMGDPYIRTGIRYYLASLRQLGQSDDALMNRLFEADENERIELNALLQNTP
jgi:tetratricopeptide (TPR) repeat protein